MKTLQYFLSISILTIILLIVSCTKPNAENEDAGPELIGTWNLRLQTPPAFMRPGNHHDPVFIARIIENSGAQLWAIQEINDDYKTEEGVYQNHYMNGIVDALNRSTGGKWKYWFGDCEDKRRQNTGFLWDSSQISALQTPRAISEINRIDFEPAKRTIWYRRPMLGAFRYKKSGTKILAISAHHKGYNNQMAQKLREAEALELIRVIPILKKKTRTENVVILGRLGDESTEPCSVALHKAGFRDLNSNDTRTMMAKDRDGNLKLYWATSRIFVSPEIEGVFPDKEMLTLDEEWLNERDINLHNFIYYASNYLPSITKIVKGNKSD